MRPVRLLLVVLAISFSDLDSFAQKEMRDGCVYLNEKDSVKGQIGYWDDTRNGTLCFFQSADGQKTEYKPFQVSGYRFTPGKYYVSRFLKTDKQVVPVFAEFLVKGMKNLYYHRDGGGGHFLIDAGKDSVLAIPGGEKQVVVDGIEYTTDIFLHQGYLKAYFADCPQLTGEIESIKVPQTGNMIALTKNYHRLTCGDTGCVVFARKKYPFRLSLEFRYSSVWYLESASPAIPQYSGLVHFWLPRSNERMYIVTGFAWSPLRIDGVPYTVYKLPLLFEYQFPVKYIKPKIEGGAHFMLITEDGKQAGIGIDFPLAAGVLICPFDHVAFDFSAEGDFFPFLDLQEVDFRHWMTAWSLNAGIVIRL